MMSRYGITMDQAVMLCMQIFAWVDILPIDGHYSMGDKYVGSGDDRKENSYHQGYVNLRKLTDEHAAEYIKEILAELPGIEAVIILGTPAWKFVQENPDLIPEDFIIQHGPIVHPCVTAFSRFTDRQAYDFCDVISRVLARILDDDSTSIITDMNQVNNICNTNDNHDGEFVYIGRCNNEIVFTGRNRSHMEELLSDSEIGVGFSQSDFPNQNDILQGVQNEVAGLTLELVHFLVHYRDCDFEPVWEIQNEATHSEWKTSIEAEREAGYNAMEANFGNEMDALNLELGGS